jgi:hypothetical protein
MCATLPLDGDFVPRGDLLPLNLPPRYLRPDSLVAATASGLEVIFKGPFFVDAR